MVAERLWGLVFEEEDVVGFLASRFVEADGIHLFAIRGGISDPDLVVHDDRGGPCSAGDGGLPDDILFLAPLGGKSINVAVRSWWVVAVVGGAAERGPFSLAGNN